MQKKLCEEIDLCVFILSMNRPEFLEQAVKSVLEQNKKPKQIIILDNGSKLAVKKRIRKYLKKNNILWIGSTKQRSPIWNTQRTYNRTKCKYIYIMHDDDRLISNFIEKQISFLENNPRIIAIGCNAYLIDKTGKRIGTLVMDNHRQNKKVFVYNTIFEIIQLYSKGNLIPFSSIVYRTENWNKAKIKKRYGPPSDSVFICDLLDQGSIAFQNLKLYEYRIHEGQATNYVEEKYFERREQYFLERISKEHPLYNDILNNIRKTKTRRNLNNWKWKFIKKKNITNFFSILNIINNSWFIKSEIFYFICDQLVSLINITEKTKIKMKW